MEKFDHGKYCGTHYEHLGCNYTERQAAASGSYNAGLR